MDGVGGIDSVEVVISHNLDVLGDISSHDDLSVVSDPRRALRALRGDLVDQSLAVAWILEIVAVFLLHGFKKRLKVNG